MKLVGCDLHARYQQIAMLDQETGELVERRAGGPDHSAHHTLEGAPAKRSRAADDLELRLPDDPVSA